MKKITITIAAVITVMSSALASGDGKKENRAAIIPGHNTTYKVLYAYNEPAVVKITIKDESGKLWRTDRIKSENGFMQRYALNKLPKGTYYIELSDQFGALTEKIELSGIQGEILAMEN